MSASSRRDRVRERTIGEIKDVARGQLRDGGPGAISLRAIARDMGMTAPALYRYYPALDSLILELAADLFTELRLACEAKSRPQDPVESIKEMARGFRLWILEHPSEAALMFGPPLPGMEQFHQECRDLQHAGTRLGRTFCDPLVELHQAGRLPQALYTPALRPDGLDDLPADVHAFFLIGWTRIYGVIMAEVFGHVSWAVTDAEAIFETELKLLTESLVS